jgi:hypothetical protein
MKAMNVADKLVSTARFFLVLAIIALPLNAQAEYYLVYGAPAPVCDYCHVKRACHAPVHRVYKVKTCKKRYYRPCYHRRSHYNMTVYYPVPVYQQRSCGCCGGCDGFLQPSYYWVSAPYAVYYARPSDRLVANRYEETYYENPSMDTGTADNDIYY